MGFQTGSQIDPRLGKLDYSGYAKAGEIQGEAMSNLGKQIGAGIEKYAKKKEDKANEDGMVDFLMETKAFGDATPEQVRAGVRGAGGGSQLLSVYKMTQDMLNAAALAPGAVDQQQAELNKTVSQTNYYNAKATPGGRAVKPTSTKDIDSAQGFLDENDLVAKDGRLFKQDKGFLGFGGSLNEVQNPEAYLGVQGVRQLLDMSKTGYGTVNAAPQGGFSIVESGAQNAPDGIEEALESVAPKDPTTSNRSAIRANSKPYEPMRYDAPERLIPGGRRGQR